MAEQLNKNNPPKESHFVKPATIRPEDLDNKYHTDYSVTPKTEIPKSAFDVKSTAEMVAFLETAEGKKCEVEARVLSFNEKEFGFRKLNRDKFVESYKTNNKSNKAPRKRLLEGYSGFDVGYSGSGAFSYGGGPGANNVGNDFTPFLGGPFYKQLYYYNDWLRMHQDAFFAYHHDPYAKSSVNIMLDFTLGKGYNLTCDNAAAQALWDAFEEANDFQSKFNDFARELSIYGENMFWWLPNHEAVIQYPRTKADLKNIPHALLPRVRLVDPSNIVEIITHPEDITRKIAYVWLTPTQYQIYGGKDPETGKMVNQIKLIYQHIPAAEMMHFTVNSVSNEKRGRSDLFAALPYFKRLRDSVNYELIAQQKNSAWAIDTIIEGDTNDLQTYVQDQEALGTIPAAGSEFVHTNSIKREYLSNSGGGQGKSNAFELGLSFVAASTGIPVAYYGSHLSSSASRASSLVATEPVAKRFEMRQEVYKRVLKQVSKRLFAQFGIKSDVNISFPEIITQDRSAKLKDLFLSETAKWITPERAATTAAQEFGYKDYDWQEEIEEIREQQEEEPIMAAPLSAPAAAPGQGGGSDPYTPAAKASAVTGDQKKKVKDNYGA